METAIIIVNEIILPAFCSIVGMGIFTYLVINLCKAIKAESENTIRLGIKIEDLPGEMGHTFKDIFSNAFAALIERRNNNDI